MATVDGPLPGPGDTSRMRYDSERQLVGMVGPDPDGGGPLNPRAMLYGHDPDGLPVLVKQGPVNGQGDGDWAGFVSLQQLATAYDVRRPVRSTQMSGGVAHAVQPVSYDAADPCSSRCWRQLRNGLTAPPFSKSVALGATPGVGLARQRPMTSFGARA